MAMGEFRKRIRATPEWMKLTLPFVIGLLASPVVQNFVDELYQMNAVLSGNVTYVAITHYLNTSGGKLLYYLILSIILIALFAVLAWFWSKGNNETDNDIKEIKKGVKELLNRDKPK